ncbi:MAG: hypothetical protein JNK82_05190 [Myxococcaceae bacterium]|nr:hypothetical protein [Myxococcaceae bacterium]
MSTNARVGGEVDAFCTKCELLLAHTVLAMVGPKIVRVRCETCKAEHAYRGQVVPKGAAKPKARRSTTTAAEKIVIGFEEQLKGKDLTKARAYSPKESFVAEEVLNHPTFGYGIVTALRGDKIDVAFKAFEKTLLHKRPDGQAARPTFGTKATPAPQPTEEGQAALQPKDPAPSTPDEGSGTVGS